MRAWILTVILVSLAVPVRAQTTGAGFADALSPSIANTTNAMHRTIRLNIVQAALSMPAEDYAFRATPDVRTFAQLIGHIINANTFFCSQADREPKDQRNYEEISDKATLVAALRESLDLCDTAHMRNNDAGFNDPVAMPAAFGEPAAKTIRGAVLMFNVAHNNEHYGNIVLYMRLKGHVPPSTANTPSEKR